MPFSSDDRLGAYPSATKLPDLCKMLRLLKGKENLAATVVTLGVMLLAVVPTTYIALLGVQESMEAYKQLTTWIADGGAPEGWGVTLSGPGSWTIEPALDWPYGYFERRNGAFNS